MGNGTSRKSRCADPRTNGPLHMPIDNEALSATGPRTMPTGIEVEGEGEWHARKHGGPKRRVWRKVHLGIDEDTLEICSVEITGSHIGDAPVLPDLLCQLPEDEPIGSITADGAHATCKRHDAIAYRGAHAVVPPRPQRRPERLQGSRHPSHGNCRTDMSGEGANSAITRFVQQNT